MTGEEVHATSKERIVPYLMFLPEHASQLSATVAITVHFQLHVCLSCYTASQTKNITRTGYAINAVTTENTNNFCYKCREAIGKLSHHMLATMN